MLRTGGEPGAASPPRHNDWRRASSCSSPMIDLTTPNSGSKDQSWARLLPVALSLALAGLTARLGLELGDPIPPSSLPRLRIITFGGPPRKRGRVTSVVRT